jgi:hypothetical protein
LIYREGFIYGDESGWGVCLLKMMIVNNQGTGEWGTKKCKNEEVLLLVAVFKNRRFRENCFYL